FPSEFLLPHTSQTYRALFDRSEAWNQSLDGTYRTLLDRAETWNQDLARHLRELIPFLDAKAVVFDGIFPFAGLAEVCTQYPTLPFAWVRRGLWQVDADEGGLVRSGLFDLVIEPGDLAETFDRGPTRLHREHVIATAPIRLGKLEAPARARFELGIDADQTSVFLHPTIPGDHRTGDALAELLRGLANGGCRFWTTNLIPDGPQQSWPVEVTRLDSLAAGRRLSGFDIAIGGADYRSAHDNAASGLPSVFMADPGKPTDDQATRAATAARDGWAILLARGDVYGARAAARRLLDPGEREVMRGRCEKDEGRALNGAEQAALAISQMVYALDLTPPSAWRNGAS
ncbi:MAG: hypothetical protein ACR2Q4_22015, partial [Geminicoccaceae bacterium]